MKSVAIFNQFQVTANIASSGQPSEIEFEEIASNGYDVVINLAMPDHEKSITNEGSIVTSLDMIYIHIPVPFDAPKEDHYAMFSGYMDALKNKKVWVHCIVNARVSAFLFRYLQANRGFSVLQAKTPILEQWLPQMDNIWKDFISHAPEQL
jgi:protein tyrosine phosphatase (PTP) superfamily phosphohydrolase (DUF442 family)